MSPLRNHRGFTLIELIVTVGIVGVVMAVTVPALLRARISGNEVSAIASLRTINTAQSAYSGVASEGNYASDLAVLSRPCPGGSLARLRWHSRPAEQNWAGGSRDGGKLLLCVIRAASHWSSCSSSC